MKETHQTNAISRILLIVAMCAACITMQAQLINSNTTGKRGTVIEQMSSPTNSSQIDQLLSFAYTFRGTPYRHGAMSPRGFDCSGFTSYVFKRFGISLSRSSSDQIANGRRVAKNELKPGDLVFFNGRARGGRIGHVGIVTEANNSKGTFKFIHAHSRGVGESHSTESYYQCRYMGACRVIEN